MKQRGEAAMMGRKPTISSIYRVSHRQPCCMLRRTLSQLISGGIPILYAPLEPKPLEPKPVQDEGTEGDNRSGKTNKQTVSK